MRDDKVNREGPVNRKRLEVSRLAGRAYSGVYKNDRRSRVDGKSVKPWQSPTNR